MAWAIFHAGAVPVLPESSVLGAAPGTARRDTPLGFRFVWKAFLGAEAAAGVVGPLRILFRYYRKSPWGTLDLLLGPAAVLFLPGYPVFFKFLDCGCGLYFMAAGKSSSGKGLYQFFLGAARRKTE